MVSNTSIEITPSIKAIQKEVLADYSALLLLPVAAVAAHQYSKKQMRKLGRKMLWQLLKMKVRSMLSFKKGKGSGIKLLLILLGLGFIVAIGVFLSWSIAITLLLVGGLIGIIYSAKD
ncbi:hypothetical protein [Ferruginibacter sp.]|nr:hypothetical protein [Ferruginibacter sp.]